jgi:glycosyltransferase involved in cell wall biosynthesis
VQWIDAHFGYPDGVAAALVAGALGLPCSITIRGNEMVHGQDALRRGALRWAFQRATRIIAVSDELREFAVSLGTPPERAVAIPNGVDGETFFPRDRASVRAALEVPHSARLILSAGGLGPGKGHHLLIRSVAALAGANPELRLWIAGSLNRDGDYEKEIRALIEDLGMQERIRLIGAQPSARLAELMSAADLFSLASFSEGWPNVVHEALACGTPVVATRVGAVPQMLPSEEFGLTVPPGDVPALTAALRRGLERSWDREAISAHGRARSWAQVASEVACLITDALASLGQ